nr:MAG: polyprotein [Picornavirales sp.]
MTTPKLYYDLIDHDLTFKTYLLLRKILHFLILLLIISIIITIMAFSRFQAKNEEFEYSDSKLQYLITRNKKDYELACDLLRRADADSDRKRIIMGFMPNNSDVLDYGDNDFKYFIDSCRKLQVDMPFTIVGEKARIRETIQNDSMIQEIKKKLLKRVQLETNLTHRVFIIKDWIEIESFLKYVRKLRKGEQHAICINVMKELHDKWFSTYRHNTEKDYMKLMGLYDYLRIQTNLSHDKLPREKYMKAQMMQSITQIPTTVRRTIDVINRIPDTCNKVMDAIDAQASAATGTSDNLNKFNEIVDRSLRGIDSTMSYYGLILTCVKFVSFGYMLTEKANRTLQRISALLVMMIPNDFGDVFRTFTDTLIRAVQGIINRFGVRAQTGEDNSETDKSIISCFYELLKWSSVNLFKDIPTEKYKQLNLSANKIHVVADFLRSAKTIGDYFALLVTKVLELFGDVALKYYGIVPEYLKNNELSILVGDYQNMYNKGRFESCLINGIHAKELVELLKKCNNFEMNLARRMATYSSLSKCAVLPYLRLMIRNLENISNRIPPHLKSAQARRNRPFWLYIFGEPRKGKSSTFQPYIISELVRELGLRDDFEDPNVYTFTRVIGAEFWDKYNCQPVVQINDALQNYADDQMMNKAIVELTNMIDDAPWPLNMSYVDDKGAHYFNSQLVVSNAQADIVGQTFIENKCWSGGEHIYARRNMVVELKLNDKYLAKNGTEVDWQHAKDEASKGNRSKHIPFLPGDLWQLVFYDKMNHAIISIDKFDDGCDRIVTEAKKFFKVQSQYKDELFDCLRNKWCGTPIISGLQQHTTVRAQMDNGQQTDDQQNITQQTNNVQPNTTQQNVVQQNDTIPAVPRSEYQVTVCGNINCNKCSDAVDNINMQSNVVAAGHCIVPKEEAIKISDDFDYTKPILDPTDPRLWRLDMRCSQISFLMTHKPLVSAVQLLFHNLKLLYPTESYTVRQGRRVVNRKFLIQKAVNVFLSTDGEHVRFAYDNPPIPENQAKIIMHFFRTNPKIFELLEVYCVDKTILADLQEQQDIANTIGNLRNKPESIITHQANTTTEVTYEQRDLVDSGVQVGNDVYFDATCACGQYVLRYMTEKYGPEFARFQTPLHLRMFEEIIAYRHHKLHLGCIVHPQTAETVYQTYMVRVNAMTANAQHTWLVNKILALWHSVTTMMTVALNTMWFWGILGICIFSIGWITDSIASLFSRNETTTEVEVCDENTQTGELDAQTAEGSTKAKRTIRVRRLNHKRTAPKNVKGQMYDQQNIDLEMIIKNHFVAIHSIASGDTNKINPIEMNAFCVGGSIFAMPRHYWIRILELKDIYENEKCDIKLRFRWNEKLSMDVPLQNVDVYLPEHEHCSDIAYIRVKRMSAMRDLRKFFVRDDDEPSLFGAYLYGLRAQRVRTKNCFETAIVPVTNVALDGCEYELDESVDRIFNKKLPRHVVKAPQAYTYYNAGTVAGDCGLLLVHVDSKKCGPRRLMGIHTAGAEDITGFGASIPIFAEDLDEVFEYFDVDEPVIVMESDPPHISCQMSSSQMTDIIIEEKALIAGSAGTINNKQIRAMLPRKTKIVKSVVYDMMEEDFGPSEFKPAHLSPFRTKDGETISPFHLAFKKIIKLSNLMENDLYEEIKRHMGETVMLWHSPYMFRERRILTDDETTNGIEGLKAIDMSTSPGCPYNTITNANGKLPWFDQVTHKDGTIHYKPKGLLLDRIKEREEKALQNIIMETICIETLKDETRPNAKVDAGKSRLFQILPMDLNWLIRKYFGMFIAHITLAKDSEIAVGINPNSMDWTVRTKDMLRMTKKFMDGDFSDYDASLACQWCLLIADMCRAFYDDGEEMYRVRLTLLMSCLTRYDLIDVIVILVLQGNTSGNALTAVFNSAANMGASRYAFMKILGTTTLGSYLQLVRALYYGDDLHKAISEMISQHFNMFTYQGIMAELGMKYTAANKEDEIVETYDIKDCTFLKRNFTYDKNIDGYRAQLDHKVVMNIPRWSESDPTNMTDQLNRFNACLLELSNYSRKEFENTRRKFANYIIELRKLGFSIDHTKLFTYDYCFELMFPNIPNGPKRHVELADSCGFKLSVLQFEDPNDYTFTRVKGAEFWDNGSDCIVGKLETYGEASCEKPSHENQITAQAQMDQANNVEQGEFLADDEVRIIRRRCTRCISHFLRATRPLIRATRKEITKILREYHCDERRLRQIIQIFRESMHDITNELRENVRELEPIPEQSDTDDDVENIAPLKAQMYQGRSEISSDEDERLYNDEIDKLERKKKVKNIDSFELMDIDFDHWAQVWLSKLDLSDLKAVKDQIAGILSKVNIPAEHQNMIDWFTKFKISMDIRKILAIKRHVNDVFLKRNTASIVTTKSKTDEIAASLTASERYELLKTLIALEGKQNLKAQMSQTTTTFEEPEQTEIEEITTHFNRVLMPVGPEAIEGFVSRPAIMQKITWTGTQVLGTPISSLQYPAQILLGLNGSQAETLKKLSNTQLFRPDIEVAFRLTSTPMHYGRLLISVTPLPGVIHPTLYNEWRNATGNQWYQMDANSSEVLIIKLPYVNIMDSMPLYNTKYTCPRDTYMVRVFVSAPLQMTQTTPTPVSLTIYARIINPRHGGFTLAPIQAQMDPGTNEMVQQSEQKTSVSDKVQAMGDFISGFEDVPMIGAYAKPVGRSIARSAKLLKKFGYSVPQNLATPQPVTYRTIRYNTCDDNPNSIVLGQAPDACVAKDFSLVNDTPDCMSITRFCQRPFLLYTGRIQSTDTPGQILWNHDITPMQFNNTDYNTPFDKSRFYGSPAQFMSRFFQMWRGSIRYHISFISTPFHACTVRLAWEPAQGITLTTPSDAITQNLINHTIIINEQKELSFCVPMQQHVRWLAVGDLFTSQFLNHNNGHLYMQMVNPLTSTGSTVYPLYFQVFVSVGDDFQFAMPSTFHIKKKGRMLAQMGSIAHSTPASSSYKILQEMDYPPIGGSAVGGKFYRCNNPYDFHSIKQLCNMVSVVTNIPGWMGTNPTQQIVPPANNARVDFLLSGDAEYTFFNSIDSKGRDTYQTNYLLNMMAVFAFNRGGFRYVVKHDMMPPSLFQTTSSGSLSGFYRYTNVVQVSYEPDVTGINSGSLISWPIAANASSNAYIFNNYNQETYDYSEGLCFFTDFNKDDTDFIIPYNSINNCRHNCHNSVANFNDDTTARVNVPAYETPLLGETAVPTPGRAARYVIFLAGADDFIMGYQLTIPASSAVDTFLDDDGKTTTAFGDEKTRNKRDLNLNQFRRVSKGKLRKVIPNIDRNRSNSRSVSPAWRDRSVSPQPTTTQPIK